MKFFFEKLFYPIFFSLFCLSFFLMEGEYKFYLFALWSIFLLASSFFLKSNQKFWSKSVIFAIILSIFFIINTFLSQHIPLSLEKLFFYLISLAIFICFKLLPKKYFKEKVFLYYLSFFSLILNFFVLFFMFFDLQQDFFPTMNLLTRSYGHNHYAAFLLLVIPVFWWQFLSVQKEESSNKKEIRILSAVLLLSSYLIMIASLARIALLLALLQLVLIFFINKKLINSEKSKLGMVIAKVFISIFLTITLLFLSLSIPFNHNGETFCPLIFNKKEICKPILENDRFVYWQRAWSIFRENPYRGCGLKGFNFASRQFVTNNYQFTSYAHNIFLHNLAEGGLFVGSFFIFFILYVFYKSFFLIKRTNDQLHKFLWIAALFSLFNAMFDFDWQFFAIFSLTLIFLAIILQHSKDDKKSINQNIFKTYYIFIAIISIFFAGSNLFAYILYKQNRFDLIIRYFPYIYEQVSPLFVGKKLQINDFSNLYYFYQHDPDFLYNFSLVEGLESKKKTELEISLSEIDPIFFVLITGLEESDPQAAKPLIDKFVKTVNAHKDSYNNNKLLDYWKQRNLSVRIFRLANQAYKQKDTKLAVDFYQKAISLNEYAARDVEAFFLNDSDYDQATDFLKDFKDFDPKKMYQYFYPYLTFYQNTLVYLFVNNRMDDFFILSEKTFRERGTFYLSVSSALTTVSTTKELKIRLANVYEHFDKMNTDEDLLLNPKVE